MSPETVDAIEKIRTALNEEKVPRKLRDLLDGPLSLEVFQRLADEAPVDHSDQIEALQAEMDESEELAGQFEAVVEAIGSALDNLDELENAEDSEAKADARASLLESLHGIVEAFEEIEPPAPGMLDADGYDILTPEEKALFAEAERAACGIIGAWLEAHRAELLADLPHGGHRDPLGQAIESIILELQYRGETESDQS